VKARVVWRVQGRRYDGLVQIYIEARYWRDYMDQTCATPGCEHWLEVVR